jgi:MFS family permease
MFCKNRDIVNPQNSRFGKLVIRFEIIVRTHSLDGRKALQANFYLTPMRLPDSWLFMKHKTISISKIMRFFALRQSFAAVLAMAVLVGLGEKMAERFLPIYLITLGGGAISVGLLNGLDNLLSALYSFPGGYLSDKLGYRKALLLFNLLAILGFIIVIIFPSWQAVIVGSLFFLSWTAISLPATMSMVSELIPQNKQAMGVTMHSMVRRIPMALGPLIGGLFIQRFGKVNGVRYAFITAIGFTLLSLIIQQVYIQEPAKAAKAKLGKTLRLPVKLQRLLISDILIRFCEQIPYAFVVIWVMDNHGLKATQFGVLSAIEMLIAMLIYIPVAYLADKRTKRPVIAITYVNFTLFPLLLSVCKTFPAFIFAFILRGLNEFGEPTRKALILELAPRDAKATTFGTYYLIRDVIVAGAAFGGAFLWRHNPYLNLYVASGFGLLGTLYFIIRVK